MGAPGVDKSSQGALLRRRRPYDDRARRDFLLVPPGGAHGFSNDAGAGFLGALVFFGIHLVLVGALLSRSGYDPPILGGLLVAAGVGYVVDSLASLLVDGYGGHLAAVLLTPAVVGEVGLTLWFLTKGVSRPR